MHFHMCKMGTAFLVLQPVLELNVHPKDSGEGPWKRPSHRFCSEGRRLEAGHLLTAGHAPPLQGRHGQTPPPAPAPLPRPGAHQAPAATRGPAIVCSQAMSTLPSRLLRPRRTSKETLPLRSAPCGRPTPQLACALDSPVPPTPQVPKAALWSLSASFTPTEGRRPGPARAG